jgi:hypothetical protein
MSTEITPMLPFYCRRPFAIVLVTAATAAGALYFEVLNRQEPVGDLDYQFYAVIYTGIGTVTGLAAWYAARLTARGSTSLARLALLLSLPYVFITLLALDKNPVVAIVAAVAFGFILFLAWLGHRARTS